MKDQNLLHLPLIQLGWVIHGWIKETHSTLDIIEISYGNGLMKNSQFVELYIRFGYALWLFQVVVRFLWQHIFMFVQIFRENNI